MTLLGQCVILINWRYCNNVGSAVQNKAFGYRSPGSCFTANYLHEESFSCLKHLRTGSAKKFCRKSEICQLTQVIEKMPLIIEMSSKVKNRMTLSCFITDMWAANGQKVTVKHTVYVNTMFYSSQRCFNHALNSQVFFIL